MLLLHSYCFVAFVSKSMYLRKSSDCLLLYPRFEEEGGYTVFALSVRPSATNTFCHTFLSNHASQPFQTWCGALARGPTLRLPNSHPCLTFLSNHASQRLQTWYGALARGPTSCLPKSCPPVIYFLFFDRT